MTPSQAAGKAHQRKLKAVIRRHRAASQMALIGVLNPIIRGWTRYYATANSSRVFAKQNALTQRKLVRWAQHRHPGASRPSLVRRYWSKGWRFTAQAAGHQLSLALHTDTRLSRHVQVQGARSPYDGDWLDWGTRRGRHPARSAQGARLLKRQRGKCAWCGRYLKVDDLVENDHRIPRSQHGTGWDGNRQLVPRHCHDTKSTHDKGQAPEEPAAGKLARPVCAVRRLGVSLAQPGSTQGRGLGQWLTLRRTPRGTGACHPRRGCRRPLRGRPRSDPTALVQAGVLARHAPRGVQAHASEATSAD